MCDISSSNRNVPGREWKWATNIPCLPGEPRCGTARAITGYVCHPEEVVGTKKVARMITRNDL